MKQSKPIYPRVRVQKTFRVEQCLMTKYAQAAFAKSAVFTDSAEAKKCGYKDIIAHPTFPVSFEPIEEICAKIEIEPERLMLVEQRFEYFKAIHPGEEVIVQSRLADASEKSVGGNKIVFISIETTTKNKRNKDLCKGTRTFIYTPSKS